MSTSNALTVTHSPTPGWLTQPLEFEDQRRVRTRRSLMRLVILLVVGALAWAAVAPIRELSVAHGQLIPQYEVRPVQHLEGGIVAELLVKEGQLVDAGQPLMRLEPAGTESDLSTLRVRAHNLKLESERAEALLTGRDIDASALGKIDAGLIAGHVRVHKERLDQRTRERELLLNRIGQKKTEIAGLESQIPMQVRLAEMQKERLEGRQKLYATGAMSKKQVLEVESLYEQARIQLHDSERKLALAKEAVPEAEATLAEADAQARKLWSEEFTKASSELSEVQESIRKHEDKVDRLVIRAPVKGRVQGLIQRSPGEVVPPGEDIVRIVPVGDDLLAEVRIKPEDVADIKVGDRADIKVSAFDYTRYGKLQGNVESISPTTFVADDKEYYYQGRIRLDPERSASFTPYSRLQPGMVVEADIISGSKSLLRYMLKPVFRGLDVAFSER